MCALYRAKPGVCADKTGKRHENETQQRVREYVARIQGGHSMRCHDAIKKQDARAGLKDYLGWLTGYDCIMLLRGIKCGRIASKVGMGWCRGI